VSTVIYIDRNAWSILKSVKNLLEKKGLRGQSYSDVIRYLFSIAKNAEEQLGKCGEELEIEEKRVE
jgi:hypothetical protein